METNADGQMSSCPFSGTALCKMSPFEHVAAWQNALTTTTEIEHNDAFKIDELKKEIEALGNYRLIMTG